VRTKIGLITIFILLILALIYFLFFTKEINLLPPAGQKFTEFSKTTIAGFKEGQKIWELYAERGFSEKGETTTFENVKNGMTYENGKAVLKNMKADSVSVSRRSEEIQASGKVEGQVRLKDEYAGLKTNQLKYMHQSKRAFLSGNVEIKGKSFTLSAGEMEINYEKDLAFIKGSLTLIQPGKAVIGEQAIYNLATKQIEISFQVRGVFEKGSAILKEETLARLKNPEAREALREKTMLECQKISLLIDKKDAQASGKVTVSQNKREAKADQAEYLDKDETIILTGKVKMKKENEWLSCQKIVVSVKNETFEAVEVETKFRLKK